jgi:hypothetical protein
MSKQEEYPEEIIDGRGEDDGFLSAVIEKAQVFSQEMVKIFPTLHPSLTKQEIYHIQEIVRSYSYIGFRRGYLQGYNDAKQQDHD